MRTTIALGLLFSLCGCAEMVWTKRNFTQQMFLTDKYECERDTRQVNIKRWQAEEFFARCMEAREWRLVEKREPEKQASMGALDEGASRPPMVAAP